MPVALKSSFPRASARPDSNRLEPADRAAHDWYRFVLSFPPHLVRQYLERFDLSRDSTVLDPFCGTGTTLVECKKLGYPSIGIEAHPMSHFASATKMDWSPDPDDLESIAGSIAERAIDRLDGDGIIDDPQPNLIQETPAVHALQTLPAEALKLL